mmetsp:Transcript_21108/g.42259  ORF Transcript_21108/g.42259 Transcript_21108/m.42259 type:complete len:344 (+) Transcript_21108:166-1197(+)
MSTIVCHGNDVIRAPAESTSVDRRRSMGPPKRRVAFADDILKDEHNKGQNKRSRGSGVSSPSAPSLSRCHPARTILRRSFDRFDPTNDIPRASCGLDDMDYQALFEVSSRFYKRESFGGCGVVNKKGPESRSGSGERIRPSRRSTESVKSLLNSIDPRVARRAEATHLGEAISFSHHGRLVVESRAPHRVVHCNAGFLRLSGLVTGGVVGVPIDEVLSSGPDDASFTASASRFGFAAHFSAHSKQNKKGSSASTAKIRNPYKCVVNVTPVVSENMLRAIRSNDDGDQGLSESSSIIVSHWLINVGQSYLPSRSSPNDDASSLKSQTERKGHTCKQGMHINMIG